jgi:hypothetical protein
LAPSFENQVFINCPFDKNYEPLLKPLLFTVIRLDLFPRIASERLDSAEVRLDKIKELIQSSQFSIHDLSRSKSSKKGEFFRMNMPFELGLDLGCKTYNPDEKYQSKKILILESEKYSTQKALSDLSFADCKTHKGEAEEIVYEVRNWFYECGFKNLESASAIWDDFNYFYTDLYEERIKAGFKTKDIDRLPMNEFIDAIFQWLEK